MPQYDDRVIPILRAGETAGPFEVRVPREILFDIYFHSRTTRWERFRLRAKLMREPARRALFERFRPWFDAYGWDDPA